MNWTEDKEKKGDERGEEIRWDEKEKKEEAVIGCVLAECEEEICRHLPAQSDNQFRRIRNQFKRVLAATKANINTNMLKYKHNIFQYEHKYFPRETQMISNINPNIFQYKHIHALEDKKPI